jgi:hypothetical protein
LINEVLDLAKIESGSIDLSMEPVELACMVGNGKSLPKKAFYFAAVFWLPDLDSNQGPAD